MSCVVDNPSCPGTCANCELDRLRQERDEARMVAHICYWRMSPLVMDLETGKYWHKEKYPWLK